MNELVLAYVCACVHWCTYAWMNTHMPTYKKIYSYIFISLCSFLKWQHAVSKMLNVCFCLFIFDVFANVCLCVCIPVHCVFVCVCLFCACVLLYVFVLTNILWHNANSNGDKMLFQVLHYISPCTSVCMNEICKHMTVCVYMFLYNHECT